MSSERIIGILGIGIGIVLLLSGSFYYEDLLLKSLGGIFIVLGTTRFLRGLETERSQQKAEEAIATLQAHEAEMMHFLEEGRTLDWIAGEFLNRYTIPVRVTSLIAVIQLRNWLTSPDSTRRELAIQCIARQRVDAPPLPDVYLAELSETGFALYFDDNIMAHRMPPGLSKGGTDGALLLTPAYLYFLPLGKKLEQIGAWFKDQIKDIPLLRYGLMPVDMLEGLYSIYRNPFSKRRVKKLQKQFRNPGSFAVPLAGISKLGLTRTFTPMNCIEVTSGQTEDEYSRYWFDTVLRKEENLSEESIQTWADRWIDRLQTVALGKGNDLISTSSGSAPQIPFEVVRTHSFGRRDSDIAAKRPKGQLYKLVFSRILWVIGYCAVWIGLVFLSITLQSEILQIFSLILLLGPMLGLMLYSFWREWIGRKMQSERRALIQSLLLKEGGLEQLVAEKKRHDGTPSMDSYLKVAALILEHAQSGSPNERRLAARWVAAQRRHPAAPPKMLIPAFSAGETVFDIAEHVRSDQPETSDDRKGSLILGTDYLYFFEYLTIDALPLIETSRFGRFFLLDTQRLANLEAIFENEYSFAVPLNQITALQLVSIQEEGNTVFCVEMVYESSDMSVHTHRFRLYPVEHPVQQNQIPPTSDVWEQQIPGRFAMSILWMNRIQAACALVGNLLVWNELRPNLFRP